MLFMVQLPLDCKVLEHADLKISTSYLKAQENCCVLPFVEGEEEKQSEILLKTKNWYTKIENVCRMFNSAVKEVKPRFYFFITKGNMVFAYHYLQSRVRWEQ